MQKRPTLYTIREPEAPSASNVVPIDAVRPSPRLWRDLMRRLEKTLPHRKPPIT